jgi:L-seryl-tRNA(Ser) seleniumtransferase
MNDFISERLREIPGVDTLLTIAEIQEALSRYPRKLMLESLRHVLETQRKQLLVNPEQAHLVKLDHGSLVELTLDHLRRISEHTLQQVVNATGIIIHTNLGRSLVAQEALMRLQTMCSSYNNLEYDIAAGRRGSRYVHAESILRELTGAEAALVVNNNAGAVLLVLNTLASGREVIVSRGQLVEIGGSFRIPDVMRSSGAVLREVGCTNRTHVHDYEGAVNERTALLLRVHMSNYRIVGFSSEVKGSELAEIGRKHGIAVMEDLGSGCLIDLSPFGLTEEPTVQEIVQSGVDVITFSGDKLLGGPQAGIIVGRQDIVARCRKNPLTRALRVDKMTLAVLEATLRLYRDKNQAIQHIPTLRMISLTPELLQERADTLARQLRAIDLQGHFTIRVQQGFSQVGGGSLPDQNLPSYTVALCSSTISTQRIEAFLRLSKPSIVGRIEADQYLMDVRTLQPDELPIIGSAFQALIQHLAPT